MKEANTIFCYNNYFERCGDANVTAPVKYIFVSPNLKNINFIHNTFIDGTSIELDSGATGNTWANNIFKKTTGNIFTGSPSGIFWAGNIYQGTLGISIPSGMTSVDPQLVLNSAGYYGLASSSPAIDAASASYPAIPDIVNVDDDATLTMDISGQARAASAILKDVGCDEYGEVIGDGGLPATALFHAGIVGARTLAGLDRLDRGRERDIAGIVWHDQGPRLQREGGRPAGGQVAAEPLAAGVLPLVGTRAVPTCDATRR